MKIKTTQSISLGLALALLIPANVMHAAQKVRQEVANVREAVEAKNESGEKKTVGWTFRSKIALGLAGLATALIGGTTAYYATRPSSDLEERGYGKLEQVNAKLAGAGIYVPISMKGDINAKNDNGYTGLMLAAQDNNTDMIKLLLDNGASIDATNKDGDTALILAVDHNNKEAVGLLLKRGAKVMITNRARKTAIDYATDADIKDTLTQAFAKERKKV